MKYIINSCFGGFQVNPSWLGASSAWRFSDAFRTNPKLIADIENGNYTDCYASRLAVVEIPDTATDWDVLEYDGSERIVAVVEGKLVYISATN